MSNHQRCTRCIMSNKSDPAITFDTNGYCNYCSRAIKAGEVTYFPNKEGEKKLREMIEMLKREGEGKSCDALMGISGGLDSAYLAYLGTQKWGLRVTAVHIDDGFDTAIATQNIHRLCEKCGISLITIEPDKEQYNELTRAYMLAGVPNLAVPQDNVLFTYLYHYARDNQIKYYLSGGNYALECILQRGHTIDVYDMENIKDINSKFGRGNLDRLDMMTVWEKHVNPPVKELRPLNFINYNRERALQELSEFCDFQYYGAKHLENDFTAFLQLYWLPQKFGVDKRTSHLSSMIISGQMSREEALRKMEEPLYDPTWMDSVISRIKEAFDFSDAEWTALMAAPTHDHERYKRDTKFKRYMMWQGLRGALYARIHRAFQHIVGNGQS